MVSNPFGRRDLMLSSGAMLGITALSGCVGVKAHAPTLTPVRASADRIIKITVCTRPFRADGPRLDVEQIGQKTIVHNYGHGGSGWSLSWGSSTIAVGKAVAMGATSIAVIGCGALGLTSATLLQRAGVPVTIYAKDRPPDVRSSLATGLFTPDSRICLEGHDTPVFRQIWEEMCRISFSTYQNFLGLPGDPVEWIDNYHLYDSAPRAAGPEPESTVKFAALERELAPDLAPHPVELGSDANPFPGRYTRRASLMMFNLTEYAHLLISEFLANGGHIETREFHSPADFQALPQNTLINATGYGARALFGDQTVVPVRGQLTRLIPQPDLNYGLTYRGVSLVPRRDGLVVQALGVDEGLGYGDDSTSPDRAEAETAVTTIASAFAPPGGV
ncbi:MAG: D-amino-acid oxidase [Rhodospirillales bacterium]|nr:D-amino-acid oxidase [Rhodospirillales bacterium]